MPHHIRQGRKPVANQKKSGFRYATISINDDRTQDLWTLQTLIQTVSYWVARGVSELIPLLERLLLITQTMIQVGAVWMHQTVLPLLQRI
jgi:hypothetical protein